MAEPDGKRRVAVLKGRKGKGKEPAPTPAPEWSRAAETRRAWMAGAATAASLEFLADQGLRLLMMDKRPGGEVTLHFHAPRDGETVHLKAERGEGVMEACARLFPAAARWNELLGTAPARAVPEPDDAAAFLEREGLLLEVRGGRIRRVLESAREHGGSALYGTRPRQAAGALATLGGWEGTARALAFALAVEDARGMKAPLAAQALRAALSEVSNACAHLEWLRGLAALLGRPGVAGRCSSLVDDLRGAMEEWLGAPPSGRWIIPGGVDEDFPREGAATAERLAGAASILHEISHLAFALPVPGWAERRSRFLEDAAEKAGWVGPLARAVGLERDARREEPGVYAALGYRTAGTGKKGGMLGRMLHLRVGEARFSLQAAADILGNLPEGPLLAKRGRGGRGEGFGRCEGPDGEVCCHVVLERGLVSWLAFSLPRELNRSAARCLEGAWMDEEPVLSSLWGSPAAGPAGTDARTEPGQLSLLP